MTAANPRSSVYRRLGTLLSPYWPSIVAALGCLILLTGVNLATPLLVGKIFNDVFPGRDWTLLGWILGALFVLFLLRNLFFYVSKFNAVRIGENVCFHLRKSLFERLQQMQLSYTRSQSPGKMSSRVMNDSMQIQTFIQDVLPKFLQAALLFAGILLVIYGLNWQLALASTFVLPLHFVAFRFFGRRIKRTSRQSQEHTDFATGSIIESLLGVEVVKGFTGEERGNRAFREAMEHTRQSQLASYRYVVLQKVCADLLIGLGMLALIAIGAYQVIGRPEGESMPAGDFIAFFWYIRLLYPTVIDLMSSGAKLSKAGASVERAFELLEVEESEFGGQVAMPDMRGEIEFRGVGFSYTRGRETLTDISFRVEAGEVCAVTGHSGAGKSTLVGLLPLLLRPEYGSISIDGVDTRMIKTSDLRRGIGVVFQECFLFNTSILENIRYARANATAGEIRAICEKTGADGFIRELPDGYATVVGEGGVSLSRGQKQLITISRAMLKRPRILILDEATASLDSELEAHVLPVILEFMRGRTTLMITHNPKLLEHADSELELSEGRLVRKRGLPAKSADRGVGGAARSVLLAFGLFAAVFGVMAPAPVDAAPQGGGKLALTEAGSKRLRLSYTDPKRCLQMLKIYGVSTGVSGGSIPRGQLPAVVAVPSTSSHNTIPDVKKTFPLTEADPLNEVIIFYDPEKPEQLGETMRLIRERIDVPARQIMIEAMVLEISESGLDRLGVDWTLSGGSSDFDELRIGDIDANADSLSDQLVIGAPDVFGEFDVDLRALVIDGDAEVLSRPSVLTLDNRMAFINVSRKIPIAETKFQGNQNISTVSFRDETVGIQLAVRPRINDAGREVSMQVNATVSARVPNEDVEVLDSEGRSVAKAPTISVREVKTYARIANNTPFIIGGLISKDDLREQRTVPILGDIPVIGKAFGSTEIDRLKREVIIVITPYVLPEDVENRSEAREKIVGRFLPKGEDTFDSFGNELFRDAYRIRDEDVFELDFLIESEVLDELQAKAEQAVDANYNLRDEYPFSNFVNGRVPGEQVLVYRQMYEVIKRIGIDEKVDPGRSIVFESKDGDRESFDVTFLDDLLRDAVAEAGSEKEPVKKSGDGLDVVWEAFADKALAITFREPVSESGLTKALESPVPEIRVVDVPDEEAYEDLFWELNQPAEDGAERHTILLQDADDLQRVKRAIVLRDAIELNAVERTLTLDNFSVGRFLLLPTREREKIDLIDGEVARLFFFTERYYDALRERLRKASEALEERLDATGAKDGK